MLGHSINPIRSFPNPASADNDPRGDLKKSFLQKCNWNRGCNPEATSLPPRLNRKRNECGPYGWKKSRVSDPPLQIRKVRTRLWLIKLPVNVWKYGIRPVVCSSFRLFATSRIIYFYLRRPEGKMFITFTKYGLINECWYFFRSSVVRERYFINRNKAGPRRPPRGAPFPLTWFRSPPFSSNWILPGGHRCRGIALSINYYLGRMHTRSFPGKPSN